MALTKSARAWLERRMFGTVRNDLNLARTATTNSWPQADTIVKMKDKPLIISLQKSSFTTNISSVVLHDFLWEKAGTSQSLHSVILAKKLKVHLFRPIIWEGISNHTQCQFSIFMFNSRNFNIILKKKVEMWLISFECDVLKFLRMITC